MNLPTFEQLEQIASTQTPIREREEKHYSVFKVEEGFTYKRFHYPLDRIPPGEGEWALESRILTAIVDVPGVPFAHGYQCHRVGDELVIHYLREHIEGELIDTVTGPQSEQLARFFAALHQRLITTNDPHLGNFIVTPDGVPHFIDFGKASQYPRRNLTFYLRAGRELFKVKRAVLKFDPGLWQRFEGSYLQQMDYGALERGLIGLVVKSLSLRSEYRERRKRKKLGR